MNHTTTTGNAVRDRIAARRALLTAAFERAGVSPLPFGHRVPCPHCRARVGEECSTRKGKVLRSVHDRRVVASRDAERNRSSKLLLLKDDPRFGLAAGDVLIGYPYAYDSKWTIVRRDSDGFVPECNQYSSDVAWIDWV